MKNVYQRYTLVQLPSRKHSGPRQRTPSILPPAIDDPAILGEITDMLKTIGYPHAQT